jgi:hypothetical protein
MVSLDRNLHGMCGFTEVEVKAIVKKYLRKNDQEMEPIVQSMRKLYNGYLFSASSDGSNPDSLYNPHLVFHYLCNFQNSGFVAKPEESTALYSTAILGSISNVGEFSVEDLLKLTITRSEKSKITTEFGYSELLAIGKDKEITWSLLFYLGILTLGPDGSLQVPNDVVRLDVRILRLHFSQLMIRICAGYDNNKASLFRF